MRRSLLIFISLLVMLSPFQIVKADESPAGIKQGNPEPATAEDASPDGRAYAKSLFEGRCQMCHQLPEPDMLKPKQWRLILGTMQQRMQQAGVPPLTEQETERLLAYLAEQAR